ncbi:hypothetical protein SAMN06265348_102503 [Pedobacter westerhofensis]|uniref:Uncharacterized protein n=1 Tax=Pedobacter westerhofensis TaxID=425512 RepID=A0A521BQT2_9SPHI|nr:hypothetical protein [Pedobacter westerhofensis]SMO49111.1 hypothetical protein SAMN06265348_102503 [Pedobacter westerhofensis]
MLPAEEVQTAALAHHVIIAAIVIQEESAEFALPAALVMQVLPLRPTLRPGHEVSVPPVHNAKAQQKKVPDASGWLKAVDIAGSTAEIKSC